MRLYIEIIEAKILFGKKNCETMIVESLVHELELTPLKAKPWKNLGN
jgi:hypothetical protein